MKIVLLWLIAITASAQTPAQRAGAALDDWHQAASVADAERYFGHFATNGVFMGTDATERWTAAQFREWAKPAFSRKSAWSFTPRDRHVDFSRDGKIAWFDEMLDTPNLGVCRGSGVLVLLHGKWQIAQYNLSIAIPNALAGDIVKQIGVIKSAQD